MAHSNDMFLSRGSTTAASAEVGKEIWAIRSGDETIPIAGADGKAELQRKDNETARVSAESARKAAESSRVSVEQSRVSAESARVEAEKKRVSAESARASSSAAATAAANSAAQSANANAANANTQANAAKSAAAQANAAARLTKPYFIQSAEPPYADRVDGGMWVETAGTAVRSINRWDSAKQGAALYPSATTYPQSTTFPAPTGEWSKFTV